MKEQHHSVLAELKSGALDEVITANTNADGAGSSDQVTDEATVFGAGIITDQPLAELVLSHLASE